MVIFTTEIGLYDPQLIRETSQQPSGENFCNSRDQNMQTLKPPWHSIYIRTVSLLSALLIQFTLVYGPFGQSNMQSTLDFCHRPARKEANVPLHKS